MGFQSLTEEVDRLREHLLRLGGRRFVETRMGLSHGAPILKSRLEAVVFAATIAERLVAMVGESKFASDLVDEALAVAGHARGAPSFAHQIRRDPEAARVKLISRMQKAQDRYKCRCRGDEVKMPKCPVHKYVSLIEQAEREMEFIERHGYASGYGGIRSSGGSFGDPDGQPGGDEAEGEA